MAICPECDADLDIDEREAEEGDQLDCPECGESFVVTGTDPLELESVDDDDDDEDEDDEAELEEEDDLDEDEEEEEEEEEDVSE